MNTKSLYACMDDISAAADLLRSAYTDCVANGHDIEWLHALALEVEAAERRLENET